ncbi:MAG: hypothetical protein LUO93_03970 [Methanomicrobiales archaeon]|nr:hypothetical protein [Methanomicrobiales archaeon]
MKATTATVGKSSNWLYLLGAIVSGVGLAAAGNAVSGSGPSSAGPSASSGHEGNMLNTTLSPQVRKAGESAVKFLYNRGIALAGLKEIHLLNLHPKNQAPAFSHLTMQELYAIGISILLFALAFLIAGNLSIQIVNLVFFLLVGAVAVLGHEVITSVVAKKFHCPSEFQFWGLGTLILLLNAAIFHFVFGKPSRTLVEGLKNLEPKKMMFVSLIGPAVNVIFALFSLMLISAGGILALAGTTGLSINIVLAAYSLIPVHPMKGKVVFDWNKAVWAGCFVPLIGAYIWLYLIP